MSRHILLDTYRGSPAANYERYFVPAIGAPLARALVALAGLQPGEHVLDVACGTGVVTRLAAEQVGDAEIAGLDVNPGMLEIARGISGDTAIEWYEASAEELPFADGTFDVVLCQMGLQFIPDRPGALREMRRVLSDGGRVVLNVPGPTPAPFAALERALSRQVGPEAADFVATIFSLYDTGEVGALLEDAGFVDAELSAERTTLEVPPGEHFLWQYIYSTPLAGPVETLSAARRAELQHEVVTAWEPFAGEDGLVLQVDVTSATASAA